MSGDEPARAAAPWSPSRRWLPGIFAVSAAALLAFWILWLSTYIVHRTYVSGDTPAGNSLRWEWFWHWLTTAGIAWALLNLHWSFSALRRRRLGPYVGHWLIAAGCGLIVIGTQAVMIARGLTMAPIVVDHSGLQTIPKSAPQPATAGIAGDPEKGRSVFAKTCITCHGPAGQGMPNLAPSLIGSSFVAASNDQAVAAVIRVGRGLGDPANKSGKVMPARGGNPFLSEEDISHLAAFVRVIQAARPATVGASAPVVSLAAWVVPEAKRPAPGFEASLVDHERKAGLGRNERTDQRRRGLLRALTIGLTMVHALFLTGVVVISSNLVLPRLIWDAKGNDPLLANLSVIGWILVAASWLLIAWLCFWWR